MLTSNIVTVFDDFGPSQGQVPNGGTTDDTTPTFEISFSPDVKPGDTVTLETILNNRGRFIPSQVVTNEDVARGYMLFTPTEQNGHYDFRTFVTNTAGITGPTSPDYVIDIQPDSAGRSITETDSNHTLVGGSGADTLTAIHGGDTMTGHDGADHFAFKQLPWSSSEITDFTPGVDKLDVSALLAASNYSGSDPVADGYVKLIDDGHGDTWVYFDTDGHGAADQWGTFIAKLDHVSPSQITSADLVGSTASPPPPPNGGVVLHGQSGGSYLVGGPGDDTLIGGTGPDIMTGQAGADHFEWDALPWSAARVNDFTHGVDKIDVSGLLAASHYSGTDPIGDGYVKLIDDGHGDTWLYFDTDGHGAADPWGTFVATLQGVSPATLTNSDFIFH